ncbi:hypothetical protein F511_15811 [Dorcoceras hygrometricum]|uniref:Uncharacterized protein n=1 Tax=Dorcoceras hygrometricum TaxID=472368 RepID=A0A2Z7DBA9_9LAMI|nr:hypothetical protein F511_15811 [Dorcoceras hygrometricum]
MQAHLADQDDDTWFMITDDPIKIIKPNTAVAISVGAAQWVEKPRLECATEDKKKVNLDNVVKDILYKILDNNMFSKVQTCTTAKEIWEKLIQICEDNEQIEVNKSSWADTDSEESISGTSSSRDNKYEVQCLMADDVDETKSSASQQKLQGAMKSSGDKSGYGYESCESNIAETCTHPKLDKPKFQTINFVKSSMGHREGTKSDESQIAAKPQI